MNYWLKNNLKGDYQIWIIVTLLLTMSLFVVTSAASMNMYKYGQGESHYLRKHIVIIVLSLLTLWFTHRFEYFKLRNYIRPVLLLSYVLVVYAYLYGPLINGTRRWINIPFLGTFQPSDWPKWLSL
jgi:cell division protein FtsW